MSEKSLTLLELHLGDGDINIGPFGITSGVDGADAAPAVDGTVDADVNEPDEADESSDRSRCTAKSVGGLLLALGALAVVAVAVAKLLGGDDAGIDLDA